MSQRINDTPYRRYKHYYRGYYRRYYQLHPDYRARQKELAKKRYRENRENIIRTRGEYVRALYDNWFGGKPRNMFGAGVALAAERVAVKKILPKEGFRDILWAQEFKRKGSTSTAGSFWMFDAFASREGKRCAIEVTISPHRQIRNRAAVSAFLRFFDLTLYVCTINPDLKRYYLSEYSASDVPQTVIMTTKRVKRMKTI